MVVVGGKFLSCDGQHRLACLRVLLQRGRLDPATSVLPVIVLSEATPLSACAKISRSKFPPPSLRRLQNIPRRAQASAVVAEEGLEPSKRSTAERSRNGRGVYRALASQIPRAFP
jgi:hypothetical protein